MAEVPAHGRTLLPARSRPLGTPFASRTLRGADWRHSVRQPVPRTSWPRSAPRGSVVKARLRAGQPAPDRRCVPAVAAAASPAPGGAGGLAAAGRAHHTQGRSRLRLVAKRSYSSPRAWVSCRSSVRIRTARPTPPTDRFMAPDLSTASPGRSAGVACCRQPGGGVARGAERGPPPRLPRGAPAHPVYCRTAAYWSAASSVMRRQPPVGRTCAVPGMNTAS